jgi:hypothetical protein
LTNSTFSCDIARAVSRNINCAAGQPYGLIIGADDVVLQLNGLHDPRH